MSAARAIDAIFRALAEPSRRAIVEQLVGAPTPVTELAKRRALSLSATLQHLAILEDCGLVTSEKTGRVRTFRLRRAALEQAERWFVSRRKTLEASFDRLERYLAEGDDLNS